MEYCIIASNYPAGNRYIHVFLESLVVKLVDAGIVCNVIAPQSSKNYYFNKKIRRELVSERTTSSGNKYMVYSPIYTVYPPIKIGKTYLADKTKNSYYKAVKKVYAKEGMNADVIYSHFIQAGISAVRLAKELNLPSYIANGEADTIASLKHNSKMLVRDTLDNVTGIISVSTKNKDEIHTLCGGDETIMRKVVIIPNATDEARFYHKDRSECRKILGWDEKKFIIVFTGSFIERKGIGKLSAALDRFKDVYSVFIGTGAVQPTCKNIIYCGRVPNAEMCNYLNAADVFVLPTLAEGCCNAIVEAISCGVPVISSDRSFNYDILDESNSILIDPLSVDEIYGAIKKLKDDANLREQLTQGCLVKAKELSLDVRMNKILSFINKRKAQQFIELEANL